MAEIQALSGSPRQDVDAAIGRRVHQIMWDRQMTQVRLGAMLGMDQSSVAKRLRGKLGWSATVLLATASALDTTVSYLVGETDDSAGSARAALNQSKHSASGMVTVLEDWKIGRRVA